MARVTLMERDQLLPDERRFFDAVKTIRKRPISGPFITLMNSSPDLAARFAHLGHYFHARGQADESILPVKTRTLVALILSRGLDATYEWNAWVGWAMEAGVSEETVDAIRERKTPVSMTEEDKLAYEFCTQLLAGNHRVDDSTYSRALAHFGVQGVVEVVATLGYFAMIAFPLNAFEIELSEKQLRERKPVKGLSI